MSTSSPGPNDLSKLTVPQLKALCKERNISGYSKLTKAALIQKLTDSRSTSGAGGSMASGTPVLATISTTMNAQGAVISNGGTNAAISTVPSLQVVGRTSSASAGVVRSGVHAAVQVSDNATVELCLESVNVSQIIQEGQRNIAEPLPISTPDLVPASVANPPSGTGRNPPTTIRRVSHAPGKKKTNGSGLGLQVAVDGPVSSGGSSVIFKVPALPNKLLANCRSVSVSSVEPESGSSAIGDKRSRALEAAHPRDESLVPPKKTKLAALKKTTTQKSSRGAQAIASSSDRVPSSTSMNAQPPSAIRRIPARTGLPDAPRQVLSGTTSSRFKPLVVNGLNPCSNLSTAVSQSHFSLDQSIEATHSRQLSSFCYLDFPPSPTISLFPIAIPPSLSQRKRVPVWALVFTQISAKDLAVCVQVSRMFRYAVYLSALYRLKQEFSGYRLAYVLEKYPRNITNMWPYLRLRELELSSRRQAYDASFLPSYFRQSNPISDRLWTSPDHDRQITVAIRFVLTRLWFALSLGHDQRDLHSWQVVDVQELATGEIWTVSCRTSLSTRETFYVLESTCEVIGRPPVSPDLGTKTIHYVQRSLPVRVDWSDYISQRLLPRSSRDASLPSLLHHLKWTNHEEYDKGISKHWLTRLAGEGNVGVAKYVVAQRYVLACVVGNSVSGQWMTTQQMAQEFAGLPAQVPLVDRKQHTVTLFLPDHHHVESVHFSTASGKRLHLALAVVQTPGREYYILKDNGMTVGCEEDGVGDVWQQLLKCDGLGVER